MNRILLLLSISCFLSVNIGWATVGVDSYIASERINLRIVLNHEECSGASRLQYQCWLRIMDKYIQQKIEKGELEDKKFEIVGCSSILNRPEISISQSKKGYYGYFCDVPNLKTLICLVDYFARPDWKPFQTPPIIDDESYDRYEVMFKQFHLENQPKQPIDTNVGEIWALDDLRVFYSDDSLSYRINNEILPIAVNFNLPVKIIDKYLLFEKVEHEEGFIHVIENRKIIQSFPVSNLYRELYDIYVYPKWVNIHHRYRNDWAISYSYDKNKFYVNDKK